MWSKAQIDQWQDRAQRYFSDGAPIKSCKGTYQLRVQVQQNMLQVLNSFLDGSTTFREFNHIFQKKAHEEWNIFHLKGMSGGMFLNKLIKYVPEEDIFSRYHSRGLYMAEVYGSRTHREPRRATPQPF